MAIGPKEDNDIIKAVLSLGIEGDSDGIIEVFGVLLTNMYADFYNTLSFDYEKEVLKVAGEEMEDVVARLLIYAAQDCGVNTVGGIWSSPEWEAVVKPHVETKEDVIRGMTAVTNALGWGNWKVIEIVPFKKLVMEAYSPYEALGYVEKYGATAKRGKCYMLSGVVGAFMDLVYPPGTEDKSIDEVRPTPGQKDLPDRIENYICVDEELCIAKGDKHCRFVGVPNEEK